MKRSISHLPVQKRDELNRIVSIVRQTTTPEMIILFGSYAKGGWVEDQYREGHITYEYMSDFDIFVVVKKRWLAEHMVTWQKVNKLIQHARDIRTWVNIIVHDIDFLNKKLSKGEYFFADMKKDGICLYNSKRIKLARARNLNPLERRQIAQEDYKMWFKTAKEFLLQYQAAFDRRSYKLAAFELHQTVEHLYITVLLVFTQYKPKIHDLEKLNQQVAAQDAAFLKIFPKSNQKEKRLFEQLKKAYIDARYKKTYRITKAELEYLAGRVKKLQSLVRRVCKAKIESIQ